MQNWNRFSEELCKIHLKHFKVRRKKILFTMDMRIFSSSFHADGKTGCKGKRDDNFIRLKVSSYFSTKTSKITANESQSSHPSSDSSSNRKNSHGNYFQMAIIMLHLNYTESIMRYPLMTLLLKTIIKIRQVWVLWDEHFWILIHIDEQKGR